MESGFLKVSIYEPFISRGPSCTRRKTSATHMVVGDVDGSESMYSIGIRLKQTKS